MAKIRVMLTCNLLDLGGTEKAIQIFAKYLDKSRFEVFACGRWRGGVRVAEIEKMGIPVILQPPDITKLVHEMFGPAVRFEVELVDAIPQEPSGKYRFCISKVARDRLQAMSA